MIKILISLIVFVISSNSLLYADTITIDYPNINTYYNYNGSLYSFNPKTKEQGQLTKDGDKIGSFVLSRDKTKIAYEVYGKDPSVQMDYDLPRDVYILDLKTKTTNIIEKIEKYEPYGINSWSPDSKYLLLSGGADVAVGYNIFDVTTHKQVGNLVTWGNHFLWLNKDDIVYITNTTKSISLYSLKTASSAIIKEMNDGGLFLVGIEDNKINFKFITIIDKAKMRVSYRKMNIDGTEEQIIREEEENLKWSDMPKEKYVDMDIRKKILSYLPNPYNTANNLIVKQLDGQENWFLISSLSEDKSIFIIDILNPQSLLQIASGSSAVW